MNSRYCPFSLKYPLWFVSLNPIPDTDMILLIRMAVNLSDVFLSDSPEEYSSNA